MKRVMGVFLFLSLIAASIVGFSIPASATLDTDSDKCYDTVLVKDAWDETVKDAYDETVKEAWDEVVEEAYIQRYSWTGGPHESDDPPVFPNDHWQANVEGDPHGYGHQGAYFVSNGNSGKGDWFYLDFIDAVYLHHDAEIKHHDAVVVHHDAVYNQVEKPCDVVKPPEPEAVIQLRTSDKVVCSEDRVYIKVESREAIFTYDEVSNTYKQTGWTEWIHILTDERDATDKECPPAVHKPNPKPTTPVEQDTPVNTDRELPDTGAPSGLILLGGLALAGAGYVIYRKNK